MCMQTKMISCYPTPNKAKSFMLCDAFAKGCGGAVVDPRAATPSDAFFYGVVPATRDAFNLTRANGCHWYYADNSYFDRGRQAYYRITRNAFQVSGFCAPNFSRFDALGARIKPWRATGSHIVVCEQSAAFMELCGYGSGWLDHVVTSIKAHTDRPVRIRRWIRDKAKLAETLRVDLADAWAMVCHMSSAANEALLQGVPTFVTGECAASPMSLSDLSKIESPAMNDGREVWAAGLAANQWTVEEIKSGDAWRSLNGS